MSKETQRLYEALPRGPAFRHAELRALALALGMPLRGVSMRLRWLVRNRYVAQAWARSPEVRTHALWRVEPKL